jgi:hypothetical protein
MIKHVTLINFKEGTTDSQRAAVLAAFQSLPRHIPGITAFSVGLDLGLLEGNAGLAVFASFESQADFLAYSTHPAHGAIVFPVCGPLMAGYSTAQIEPSE